MYDTNNLWTIITNINGIIWMSAHRVMVPKVINLNKQLLDIQNRIMLDFLKDFKFVAILKH